MGLGLATTVVIAGLGYSGVARVSDMTASMLAHEAKLASVSASARADVQAMRRFEKELAVHVGNADQEAEDLARWNDQRYRLTERLAGLERDAQSNEDRDTARGMRSDLAAYESGFYRVVGLVRQRSLKSTADVSKEMAAYKDPVERLETAAGEVAAANFKRMGDREKTLASQKTWTARAMVAVMLLTVIVGSAFSVALTRGVTAPIREAVRITEAIAAGDLAVTVPASGRDELGQLLAAMGRMAGRLRGVVGEVRSGADALAPHLGPGRHRRRPGHLRVGSGLGGGAGTVAGHERAGGVGRGDDVEPRGDERVDHPERREQPADGADGRQGGEATARRAARRSSETVEAMQRSPRRSRSSRRSPIRRTCWP